MSDLNITIKGKKRLLTAGKRCNDNIVITAEGEDPVLQEKSATITANGTTEFTPDSGYDGLSKTSVTVNVPNVIPEGYIKPSGTKPITSNGTHDVKSYASVSVNVPTEGGGGGECSGEHVIPVDELPTENIDKDAMYELTQQTMISVAYKGTDGKVYPDFFAAMGVRIRYKVVQKLPEIGLDNTAYYVIGDDIYSYDEEDGEWGLSVGSFFGTMQGEITSVDQITTAGYYVFMGDGEPSYHKYAGGFIDVIMVDGEPVSLLEMYTAQGYNLATHTIPTKTTEGIFDLDVTGSAGVMHAYYIEDEKDVFLYTTSGGGWVTLGVLLGGDTPIPYSGVITNMSEATTDGSYYALVTEWKKYIVPDGKISITKDGTYDVSEVANVVVNLSIPYAKVVQSRADLPSDAPNGSMAIVIGGE